MPGPDVLAELMTLLTARERSALVTATARLSLADHLANGPRTVAELAAAAHAHEPSLLRLMRACVAIGLFQRDEGGRYELTPLSDVLRTDARPSMRALALMCGAEWRTRCWADLATSVRTGEQAMPRLYGTDLWGWLSKNEEDATNFNGVMAALSHVDAAAVVEAYNVGRFRHVIDVGGGSGTLLAAILRASPETRGTLFEVEHVLAEAQRSEAFSSFSAGRVAFAAGSFFDRVPSDGDLYVLKHILHDWSDDAAVKILANCGRAMPAGATLAVVDRVLTDASAVDDLLLDLEMLVCTGGRERTEAEWKDLLASAGLRLHTMVRTRGPLSILECQVA